MRASDPAAPSGTASEPGAPEAPRLDLHHSQIVTAPGQKRDTMAPWRDGGGNRLFSTHVFGTPFMLNEKGDLLPWIATAITSNEDETVWTMKLREDAVFQDGTPITAADFKAYWEHGAKPENIVAWGGASLTLGDIRDWELLRAGDVTEAEGLTVVDDHTLEIETAIPMPAWLIHMAAWHVGISKLDQVLAGEGWGNAPIGAGPFSLAYDPDSGLTELTRTDLVGGHWNGPHDRPIIEKLVLPNIEDEQARLMFESGELDVMRIDKESPVPGPHPSVGMRIDTVFHEAVVDPNHPLLYVSPHDGLHFIFIEGAHSFAPLRDPLVRQALAHGQDMESIVSVLWGPTATHAKNLISSPMPCHAQIPHHQPYDPDLARQHLSASTYDSADLTLRIDLYRPDMAAMGVAMKEYWKDNLGVGLDILERESGELRHGDAQLSRIGWSSWLPDPVQFLSELNYRESTSCGMDYCPEPGCHLRSLAEHARSIPMDHPDRCEALQALQQGYLEGAFVIPIRKVDGGRWLVQPWLRGFKSTFNQDFNTLTTAYVARH